MFDFIRMARGQLYGLNMTYVQGLNVLDPQGLPLCSNPVLKFFKSCSEQTPTSMYIGPMGLDSSSALLTGIFNDPLIPHIKSTVGTFRMEFYDMSAYPEPYTFFFPELNAHFWDKALTESLVEIERSLEIESILFCLGAQKPLPQRAPIAFIDEESWIRGVCDQYDAVVGGGGEDCPITLLSKSPALPCAFHVALEEAVAVVEQNRWFAENRRKLVWNGLSGCMEAPREPD